MDERSTPVDGRFHDWLETLAALHRTCEVIYRSGNGGRTVIRDRIQRLYGKEGREWLQMASGLAIGVDQLIKVDGHEQIHIC
jgi:hypothetical protein